MAEISSGPAVPRLLPGSSGEVSGAEPGMYLGFAFRETGGTASVTVVLYDNASAASGAILETVSLAAGESTSDFYPRPGRQVRNGIYAAISGSGSVSGSVFQ